MKNFIDKLKIFFFMALILFVITSFSKILMERHFFSFHSRYKNSKDVCDVKVLNKLIKFEEKNKSSSGDMLDSTVYLTGDFENINKEEMEILVCETLENLNQKEEENIDNVSTVTVIHKLEPTIEYDEVDKTEEFYDSIMQSHQLAKKMIREIKLNKDTTGSSPLVIKNYYDKERGVSTMQIHTKREGLNQSEESDVNEEKRKERDGRFINHYRDHRDVSDSLPNKISRLGPKVFINNSNIEK